MGSSHEKKKHHKKRHHKHGHKKHHRKSQKHHHRKREVDNKTIDDVLLQQAVLHDDSGTLDVESDEGNSTDSATGQLCSEHDHLTKEVQETSRQEFEAQESLSIKPQSQDVKEDEKSSTPNKYSTNAETSSKVKSKHLSSSEKQKIMKQSRSRTRQSRHRSRSKSRHQSRHRSRSRSRVRSISRSRHQFSSSHQSRLRRHSRQSRQRFRSRSGSRRRSKSSSTRYRRSSKHSNDRRSSSVSTASSLADEQAVQYPVPIIKTKADLIAEFTAFCHTLSGSQDTEVNLEAHHPFQITETKDQNQLTNVVTPSEAVININTGIDTRPIEMKFPVSSGKYHQSDEDLKPVTTENISIGEIIAQRAIVQQRLVIDPTNVDALSLMNELEVKMSQWCQGQTLPGRYTGFKEITPMDKSIHKAGVQAWAKKKMFHGLQPIKDGFGSRMLKKMGWKEGQPLGKSKKGYVTPILVDVKTDRRGLDTEDDKATNQLPTGTAIVGNQNTPSCIQGKHPVSALQELCLKKQWDPPSYELVSDTGPAHMKSYLYKVRVRNDTYQPACGSNNKKMAKAQAALACLKAIGIVPK